MADVFPEGIGCFREAELRDQDKIRRQAGCAPCTTAVQLLPPQMLLKKTECFS